MKKSLILCVLILILTACTAKQEVHDPHLFYQIFVGSFADSNGDGVGDLKGIEEKLDYLKDELGVHSLWLTPIHPSPTYHKYDVTDYFAIDPQFGTMADFESLISKAHEKDMNIIIDLVLNHSSNQHPWFQKASQAMIQGKCDTTPYCDYYNFSDKAQVGYEKLTEGIYYEAVFWSGMPDLNLDNDLVKQEIEAITAFWIEKGVDGFRLDATSHYFANQTKENTAFLSWFTKMAKAQKEDLHLVGEAWVPLSTRLSLYESGIDSFFNFEFSQQDSEIIKKINRNQGHQLARLVAKNQANLKAINPQARDSFFLSNHDQGRSAAYFGNDQAKQKFASTVLMFLPGDVYIYYGEEIGMLGSGIDENKRLPMLWGNYDQEAMTARYKDADYQSYDLADVKAQLKDKDSLLNHYRNIISIRNQYPQLAYIQTEVLDFENDAIYALTFDDHVIIHNFAQETQTVPLEGVIVDRISGKSKMKNGELSIEGYSSVIVALNK